MLYGAKESVLFPGLVWGGMSSDTAVFLQSSVNMTKMMSHDLWRIFSKMGAGYSTIRYKGEIITTVYACLPEIEVGKEVIGGQEFTIAIRGSVDLDSSLRQVEQEVLKTMQQIMAALYRGDLK